MWSTQHTAETTVDADRLWKVFTDIHTGRLTLPGGDVFEADGPLGVGATLRVTPAGQDTFTSRVIEFEPGRGYADVTEFGGLVLTFRHTFEPTADGTRVTHALRVEGEGEAGIGPAVSEDFPAQMQALFAAAS